MKVSVDIYEYIVSYTNDKTIISMLSVNKKFSDDIQYKKVLQEIYSLLLHFKQNNESYKQLFLRMTKYIAKLENEFKIRYIKTKGYDPQQFYKTNVYTPWQIYDHAMEWATMGGHKKLIESMIQKYNFKHTVYESCLLAAW